MRKHKGKKTLHMENFMGPMQLWEIAILYEMVLCEFCRLDVIENLNRRDDILSIHGLISMIVSRK